MAAQHGPERSPGDGAATEATGPTAARSPAAKVTAGDGTVTEGDGSPAANGADQRTIPEAAVSRLAVYLRVLSGMAESEVSGVSSEELSAASGVNPATLRKDLSYIGSYGRRGVGYDVAVLVGQLERTLGLTRNHSVAVVGIGNLGHALANYGGFPGRGFPVRALFDVEEDLIGVPVGGIPVSHLDEMAAVCTGRGISIGVIATPVAVAQAVCDRLVSAGVRCILNFAPVVLSVPDDVEVRKVDLAAEMQILSFHVAHRGVGGGQPVTGTRMVKP